jgi:tetratricopeptide (TPR) repeat protein
MQLLFDIIEDSRWSAGKMLRERSWGRALEVLLLAASKKTRLYRNIDVQFNRHLADASYNLGKFEDAIRYSMLLRPLLKDPAAIASSHVTVGGAYRRLARWDDAINEYRAAGGAYPEDARLSADCRRRIIAIYNFRGRTAEALELIDESYKLLAEDDLVGLFKLQRHHGWALSIEGRWEEAVQRFQEAESTVGRLAGQMSREDVTLEQIKGARYLADVYANWEEHVGAAAKLYARALQDLESLESRARTDIRLLRGVLLLGVAHTSIDLPGKLDEARGKLHDSEVLFSSLNEPLGKYASYIEWGRFHRKSANWDEAKSYFQLAMQGLAEIEALYWYGIALENLCATYYEQADGAGQEPLDQLLQIYKRVQNGTVDSFPSSHNILFGIHLSQLESLAGRALIRLGQLEDGVRLLCTATITGLSYNVPVFQTRFAELLAEVEHHLRHRRFMQCQTICDTYLRFSENPTFAALRERTEIANSRHVIQQKQKEAALLGSNSTP